MKKVLTAVAITLTSFGAYAGCSGSGTGTALTFLSNTTSFSCSAPAAVINDVYTFTLSGSSFLTSSTVTSVQNNTADVDFSSIYFNAVATPGTHLNFAMTHPDPTEQWGVTGLLLTAGNYELHLIGVQANPNTPGSYGGDITVTPVPEPETYALMLAGLGALGFVARRRKAA